MCLRDLLPFTVITCVSPNDGQQARRMNRKKACVNEIIQKKKRRNAVGQIIKAKQIKIKKMKNKLYYNFLKSHEHAYSI